MEEGGAAAEGLSQAGGPDGPARIPQEAALPVMAVLPVVVTSPLGLPGLCPPEMPPYHPCQPPGGGLALLPALSAVPASTR